MADDSDYSAPCAEVRDGVRCTRFTTYTDGKPEPHEHIFPRTTPSQPVYDEEKIALWLASAFDDVNGEKRDSDESWMFWAEEAERTAAALVAALRGGELTREETTP